jgi:hypothetical protein
MAEATLYHVSSPSPACQLCPQGAHPGGHVAKVDELLVGESHVDQYLVVLCHDPPHTLQITSLQPLPECIYLFPDLAEAAPVEVGIGLPLLLRNRSQL